MNIRLALGFVILVAACAGRGTAGEESPQVPVGQSTPEAQAPSPEKDKEMLELEGTLAPTVEAGGWVLETEKGAYLLLSIADYRKEPWFKEGTRVKVKGKESPDTISIFMQGMPFEVESMEPASGQ